MDKKVKRKDQRHESDKVYAGGQERPEDLRVEESKPPTLFLAKSGILEADDLKTEEVGMPEWGGTIIVREPTATERDSYERGLFEARKVGNSFEIKPNLQNTKARLAVRCIIDEDGERLFSDQDATALGMKSAAALNRIIEVIQRLAGMSKADLKELEGNSGAGQGDSSPSA